MVGRRIGTHDQNAVGILDVHPMIRHRASSERLSQSRYRGAVSDARLVFYVHQSQRPHHALKQPALLIVQRGRAHMGDLFGAVYAQPLRVGRRKAPISGFFDVGRNPVQSPVPGFNFPFRAVRGTRAMSSPARVTGIEPQLRRRS